MPRLRQPKEPVPKASARFETEELEKDPNAPFEQEEEAPEVVAAEKEAEVDASEDLKKQIAALQKAEQTQRERADKAERERQLARKDALDRAAEVEKTKGEVVQSRAEIINRAIAAETEAADAAEREYVVAMTNGDTEAAVKAQRRMSRAEANLANLNNGKAAIEAEIEDAKNRPAPKADEQQGDALDRTNLPDTAKNWLRKHPEYLSDSRKNAKIQSLHWDVVDEGHAPFSDEYYVSLETHLGMRKAPKVEPEEEEEEEEQSSGMVSAPVSRQTPDSKGSRDTGKITLSRDQREAAKMAGITETEYAKQLQKLNAEKGAGNYRESR